MKNSGLATASWGRIVFGTLFFTATFPFYVDSQYGWCNPKNGPHYTDYYDPRICCQDQYFDNEQIYILQEGKFGLEINPETFAQEGRSFCINGEHISATKLSETETLQGFYPLFNKYFFDIGNHIRPGDSSKMNYLKRQNYQDGDARRIHIANTGVKPDNHIRCNHRPAVFEVQPDESKCVNPYKIEVTEIYVHKTRLHNYLHIKVFADSVTQPLGYNCPMGKMKYLMLEVRDSVGLPVGHFTDEVPCEMDENESVRPGPNGIPGFKLIGTRKNNMPCMFAPKRAVSHPGIFLATIVQQNSTTSTTKANPGYFTEAHATWRFAQHTSNFIPELHFAALIVEDPKSLRYFTSRVIKLAGVMHFDKQFAGFNCPGQGIACQKVYNYYICTPHNPETHFACTLSQHNVNERPYGYIAQYSKLTLSENTLGGWDYFRKDFVVPKYVDCHVQPSIKYYTQEPENSKLTTWLDILRTDITKPDNFIPQKHINFVKFNRPERDSEDDNIVRYPNNQNDVWRETLGYLERDTRTLLTKYSRRTAPGATDHQIVTTYFGTKYTQKAYNPSRSNWGPSYESTIPPSIRSYLNRLRNIQEIAKRERCSCPALPTTIPPEQQTRQPLELDGRRLHAIQMFTAWIIFIPIGMFVARYFKETYSRVFFMQEFWWYSIHVLSLFTGFLFMVGGIYVVRLNRISNAPWTVEMHLHAGFGYLVIFVYSIHLILGFFRAWTAYWRIVQIMMHWFFGVMEYLFGVAAIYFTAVVLQGFLNCDTFNIYTTFLVLQIAFYIGMDIHYRFVDKKLALKPPRSYLPPPVMRIFHGDAPYSKFRMSMLLLFFCMCLAFYAAIHGSLVGEGQEVSCYQREAENTDDVEV